MVNLDTTCPMLDYSIYQITFFINKRSFKVALLSIVLSYIALTEKYYFFYAIILLDIISYQKTLSNVTKSILLHYQQLGLTAILGVTIIYLFSIVGFIFNSQDYWMFTISETASPESTCTTLYQCFTTHLSLVRYLFLI